MRMLQSLRGFFIEPANGFFAVDSVYGRSDDAMRFDFFSKVVFVSSHLFPAHSILRERSHTPCTYGLSCRTRHIIVP